MSLIKVSQIMEKIKKNPILASGLDIDYSREGILITVEDEVPLTINQAQRVVEWMAEVIGGQVKWESKAEAKVFKPRLASHLELNPETPVVDWSEVVDHTADYGKYENFLVIPVQIATKVQKNSLYTPCPYELDDKKRMEKPRQLSDLSWVERVYVFEDRYYGGLANRDLKYKYHILPSEIAPIMRDVSERIGSPAEYTPRFAKKSKVVVQVPKPKPPREATGAVPIGEAEANMNWVLWDNTKITRLSGIQIDQAKLQDQARVSSGLKSQIKIRVRQCLQCKKLFETVSNYNCGCNLERTKGYQAVDQDGITI